MTPGASFKCFVYSTFTIKLVIRSPFFSKTVFIYVYKRASSACVWRSESDLYEAVLSSATWVPYRQQPAPLPAEPHAFPIRPVSEGLTREFDLNRGIAKGYEQLSSLSQRVKV